MLVAAIAVRLNLFMCPILTFSARVSKSKSCFTLLKYHFLTKNRCYVSKNASFNMNWLDKV